MRSRPCGASRRSPLYSADHVAREDDTILKWLYSLGEKQLGRLAEELLSNPRVAEAFSRALQRAFETKGRVDRNMQRVLGLLNVPSRADLIRITSKIEAIQGSLVNLQVKVDRLLMEQPRSRGKRPAGPRDKRAAHEE